MLNLRGSENFPHNWAMLHAYKSAMETSENWLEKNCGAWDPKVLTVFASIGATMAMSQDWYRHDLHLNDDVKGVSGVIDNIKACSNHGSQLIFTHKH